MQSEVSSRGKSLGTCAASIDDYRIPYSLELRLRRGAAPIRFHSVAVLTFRLPSVKFLQRNDVELYHANTNEAWSRRLAYRDAFFVSVEQD
jgi:hypothetical protein